MEYMSQDTGWYDCIAADRVESLALPAPSCEQATQLVPGLKNLRIVGTRICECTAQFRICRQQPANPVPDKLACGQPGRDSLCVELGRSAGYQRYILWRQRLVELDAVAAIVFPDFSLIAQRPP